MPRGDLPKFQRFQALLRARAESEPPVEELPASETEYENDRMTNTVSNFEVDNEEFDQDEEAEVEERKHAPQGDDAWITLSRTEYQKCVVLERLVVE